MDMDAFLARLEGLGRELGEDQTPALERCAPIILEGIQANFSGARSSAGAPWPPRKDPKPQHPLLILEGHLLAAAVGRSAAGVNRIENGKELVLGVHLGASGTSLGGARRQQRGDSPPGILPRPYLGFSEEVLDGCCGIVLEETVKQLMEALS
ncbi:MAG: hypothetical protein IMZ55_05200 [Acidobacteria bacterium]|nr:hypothetical protein [Acidobacteriota bacterium]